MKCCRSTRQTQSRWCCAFYTLSVTTKVCVLFHRCTWGFAFFFSIPLLTHNFPPPFIPFLLFHAAGSTEETKRSVSSEARKFALSLFSTTEDARFLIPIISDLSQVRWRAIGGGSSSSVGDATGAAGKDPQPFCFVLVGDVCLCLCVCVSVSLCTIAGST